MRSTRGWTRWNVSRESTVGVSRAFWITPPRRVRSSRRTKGEIAVRRICRCKSKRHAANSRPRLQHSRRCERKRRRRSLGRCGRSFPT